VEAVSAATALRPGPPRGPDHPLGAREPAAGSLHEQNELAHIAKQVHNELIELAQRGWQAMTMTRPLNKLTVTGTAHDPAFAASVIVPALQAQGLDVGCASDVAELMDTSGCSADAAVAVLFNLLESYGTPPTVAGEPLARDQRDEEGKA
jgi:hypothetical protein